MLHWLKIEEIENNLFLCNSDGNTIIRNAYKSWFDARLDCVSNYGGDLATIEDDSAMQRLLPDLQSRQIYYIGLIDRLWFWEGGEVTIIIEPKYTSTCKH